MTAVSLRARMRARARSLSLSHARTHTRTHTRQDLLKPAQLLTKMLHLLCARRKLFLHVLSAGRLLSRRLSQLRVYRVRLFACLHRESARESERETGGGREMVCACECDWSRDGGRKRGGEIEGELCLLARTDGRASENGER